MCVCLCVSVCVCVCVWVGGGWDCAGCIAPHSILSRFHGFVSPLRRFLPLSPNGHVTLTGDFSPNDDSARHSFSLCLDAGLIIHWRERRNRSSVSTLEHPATMSHKYRVQSGKFKSSGKKLKLLRGEIETGCALASNFCPTPSVQMSSIFRPR